MSLENLNNCLQLTESFLNTVGYTPVVSSFSACARYAYGKVELITALAAAAIIGLAAVCATTPDRQQELEARAFKALEYAAHGGLNMGRALLEAIPFLSLFTCLPYDLAGRKFITYTAMTDENPILTPGF